MRKRSGREKKKHAKFRRCLAIRKEGKIRHKIKEISLLDILDILENLMHKITDTCINKVKKTGSGWEVEERKKS